MRSFSRGFGSPLLWVGLGLLIWAVTASLFLKKEIERTGSLKLQMDFMQRAIKEAQDEATRVENGWKEANAKLTKDVERSRGELDAERARVRGRPVDAGGREIARVTCTPAEPNAVPKEFISLAEYESLQDRAREDALQVTQLQDYIAGLRNVSAH